jgi:hypothetical protein
VVDKNWVRVNPCSLMHLKAYVNFVRVLVAQLQLLGPTFTKDVSSTATNFNEMVTTRPGIGCYRFALAEDLKFIVLFKAVLNIVEVLGSCLGCYDKYGSYTTIFTILS